MCAWCRFGTQHLSDPSEASSAIAERNRSFQAPVIPVSSFFEEHGLKDVALAKINIKGREYTLLPALIEAGLMPCIARLQVQFHVFEPQVILSRQVCPKAIAKPGVTLLFGKNCFATYQSNRTKKWGVQDPPSFAIQAL